MNRRMLIAASVVVLHVFVLWALQSGLMHRAVEVIIPGEILSDIISPQAPQQARQSPTPTPPRKPEPQPPKPQAQPVQAQQTVTPEPSPLVAPAAAAPAAIEASTVAAMPAAPPAPAPVRIEPPTSDAAYLNNPRPAYPALSRRLGEQGKVVVRVLIGIDGKAEQVEIRRSSGYDRLDQSALATVRSWRYAPGKRNGIPEAMWFEVPIIYLLE